MSEKDPLISNEILKNWLETRDDVLVLDASFTLPGVNPTAAEIYATERLPGARFFDIDSVKDPSATLPHMMPDRAGFEAACSALGISNTHTLVLYGQASVAMGPCRAYWMLREFGHSNVYVLNGSLRHWKQAGGPTETGAPAEYALSTYATEIAPSRVAALEDVKAALGGEAVLILDARAPDRFAGETPEPREGLRAGHMPGARNLPAGSLIDPETGGFKPLADIETALKARGVTAARQTIASCGSGVTACVLDLAIQMTGLGKNRVYDGSWTEWGQESLGTPIETCTPAP